MTMEDCIIECDSGCILKAYITPGAKKSEIVGLYSDPKRVKIKVKAPPVDGRANSELVNFLSELFGLRKNQIAVKRGVLSQKKDIFMELDCYDALKILNSLF